jgi:hypothetical protein
MPRVGHDPETHSPRGPNAKKGWTMQIMHTRHKAAMLSNDANRKVTNT